MFFLPAFQDGLGAGAYSGIFRMPTTNVLSEGSLALGFSDGFLVRADMRRPANPKAGVYSAVVGFVPGLELGASFMTPSPFNGILDDRSVALKYAPLTEPRNGFSLAFGSTDVSGTKLRASEYVVVGKRLGSVRIYGGVANGLLKGPMLGGTWEVAPSLQLSAERVRGEALAGVRINLKGRWSASAAADTKGRPFWSLGLTVPLRTEPMACAQARLGESGAEALAKALAKLGRGSAEAKIDGDWLSARYEDADARDPVATLGHALRLALGATSEEVPNLRLTVRRYGRDLVQLSGPAVVFRSFLQGFSDQDEFLRSVSIEDGGGEPFEGSARAPSKLLVTIQPGIDYRLGVRDHLLHREWLRAKAIAPLPLNLTAAVAVDLNLHDSLQQGAAVPSPAFGLYRTDRLASGTWTMLGIERDFDDVPAASLQFAHYSPLAPFRVLATVATALDRSEDGRVRFALDGSFEALHGSLSLWARHERFRAGDVGQTLGATRRFGQTWVSVFHTRTRDGGETLNRVGVEFRIPLPAGEANLGPVRFATASEATFRYQPTLDAVFSGGRGIRRNPVASFDTDITARGQLTSWYVSQHIGELVSR
jgi:hypothetical protein